jgi:hypothetical protein
VAFFTVPVRVWAAARELRRRAVAKARSVFLLAAQGKDSTDWKDS